MLTALLNLLTACLHLSSSLAAQDFPLKLTPLLVLFKFFIQESTSIFSLEEDHMQLVHLPLADAVAMVDRGEIGDAKTITALLLTDRRLSAEH